MSRAGDSLEQTAIDWRSVFVDLSAGGDDALAQILDSADAVTLPAGAQVFDWGSPCRGFVLVLTGDLRVQLLAENGRVMTLYHVRRGGTCVLTTACLLAGRDYPAMGIAESRVDALVLSAADFQAGLNRSPAFRQFVFESFGTRLVDVIQRMESVTFGTIDQRLAMTLLEAAPAARVLTLTHEDIAQELGSAREVVSRHLKRFEERGWVRLSRGRIEVLQRAALAALAGAGGRDETVGDPL